jgi:membrane-associated phospholipid phosphatase
MPLAWGLAVAIPAWTGVERILAGKHFPTDVIAGYAFGALCGYLVPGIHLRRETGQVFSLKATPYSGICSSGMRLSINF